jgi:hypothetical protein
MHQKLRFNPKSLEKRMMNARLQRERERYLVITSKKYDKTVNTLGVGGVPANPKPAPATQNGMLMAAGRKQSR